MSVLQFKLDNQPYGGTTTWTVPAADMPDYPWTPGKLISEETYRSDGGEAWRYRKYSKEMWRMSFVDISTASKGTLLSLRNADFKINFYDDVNGSGGTYAVFMFTAEEPRETMDGYWSVDVRLEEA